MQLRLIHLRQLFLLVVSLATLLFFVGLQMSKDFEQQVLAALDAGDNLQAVQMLYERQQKGVKPDALFHHSLAAIHLKNGNAEAAEHHLTKAKDLEK